MSNSIPRMNQVKSDSNSKIMSFATPTRKVNSDPLPPKKVKLVSILQLKRSNFRPPSQFRSLHWNQVNFYPHDDIKQISTTHTKTKSSSMLTLKPIYFRQAYWTCSISTTCTKTNSVDLHSKNKSCSARTKKPSRFRSPRKKPSQFRSLKWSHAIFGPHRKA